MKGSIRSDSTYTYDLQAVLVAECRAGTASVERRHSRSLTAASALLTRRKFASSRARLRTPATTPAWHAVCDVSVRMPPRDTPARAALFLSLASLVGCSVGSSDGSGSLGGPTATAHAGPSALDAGALPDAGPLAVGTGNQPTDAGSNDAGSCQTDLDCNQGATGAGIVCSLDGATTGQCISGCHSDTDCPTNDTCDQNAKPHWACVPDGAGTSSDDAGGAMVNAIAALALANVGQGACTTNSLGGEAFGTSCTGNGGAPEYWCADFALWVWSSAGVANVTGLTAAAGSFYVYGENNGTLSNTPAVGDAVVFDYQGGGAADHVAIVTQVNTDGTIVSVSGDWGGQSGSEANFAGTSSVVLNVPAYAGAVGSSPAVMEMTISGYVAPAGL
jgi:hypothetical protein